MLGRRQCLALAALAATPVRAEDARPAQPPPLSTAPLGGGVAPGWQHQHLPKVERANDYAIVAEAGSRVLHVRSAASASSWLARVAVDPARTPWLQWRWKVSRALAGSDLRSKAGDDYAARLYVFFELPLAQLGLADRLRMQAARLLSGAELPAAALCYVWGHAQPVGATGWNPYTDRVRMLVLDSGDGEAGSWRSHQRDLRRDWAEAFGGPLPPISGVAIGADTDNTGDQVEAWFGDLHFAATP